MHLSKDIGVLLLNLGTPNNRSPFAVARYLREFLGDYRVIEMPSILRWMLVNFIIVPFRASKSAAAYTKIWQRTGSPLLVNSKNLRDKLAKVLDDKYEIALGMRYGNPSINVALKQLESAGVQKIIVMPLFPQYSSAATGSALEQALKVISKYKVVPELAIKPSYFQDGRFINALAASVKPYLSTDFDCLLMSYHGLPEKQMQHHKTVGCNLQSQCPEIQSNNINCYRAQCYQTSRLLAQKLNLPNFKWCVGFQSRLGRLPWIKPYTDEMLVKLREIGVRKLVICCPSFVADCLETLEEIGIRAREQWLNLGGESLQLVPCLNAQEYWVEALAEIITS